MRITGADRTQRIYLRFNDAIRILRLYLRGRFKLRARRGPKENFLTSRPQKMSADAENYMRGFARNVTQSRRRRNKSAAQMRADGRLILATDTLRDDVKGACVLCGYEATGGEIVRTHIWKKVKPHLARCRRRVVVRISTRPGVALRRIGHLVAVLA